MKKGWVLIAGMIVILLFTFINKVEAVTTEDLISWWKFDETSGTTADDFWGSNDGTLYNMDDSDWVTGKIGNALSFDGANDYVDCGNDSSLDITDVITIEAWIKTTKTLGDIVTKRESPYTPYGLFVSSSTLWFRVYDGVTKTDIRGITNVCDGSWHYVVATYDGTNISLYVDGEMDRAPVQHLSGMKTSAYPLCIGKGHIAGYFDGVIDDVRIYNRALSADDIQANYEYGQAVIPEPAAIFLFSAGLAGLAGLKLKRKREKI